ncbi:unnamed protein product [Clonostachys rosea f. rosea IK726]|uniref:Cell wall biogenesis protein Mhp1 n=3 Tax=Bionectria ochroleuca TaxID=29856 RepID=A0A0B7KEQ2_BIOOC|nr:unnamed protein product [Clonostachys rosea f. rosea IK726]
MEQVHGVDVSWMTQASPKDKILKKTPSASDSPLPQQIPRTPATNPSNSPASAEAKANGSLGTSPSPNGAGNARRKTRSGSVDKSNGPTGPPHRRNSWFSNISAKFSGSSAQTGNTAPASTNAPIPEKEDDSIAQPPPPPVTHSRVPPASGSRNPVLPPAARSEGNGPYTPAPPKNSQAGFLGVFRRLSSSSGGSLGPGAKLGHGLVERRVLNVDHRRERCPISELNGAKLRRVSFCVDVEIAPMPKYSGGETQAKAPVATAQKKKMTESGEGEALKNPKAVVEAKEANGKVPTPAESVASNGSKPSDSAKPDLDIIDESTPIPDAAKPEPEKETTRKKEKKKKSEEERKARKEKKRKLAEANGTIPMEIRYDSSDSSTEPGSTLNGVVKTTSIPTTNPVRIYRRCCQLRETPILKKITEQLINATPSAHLGVVNKLDLTGYTMQLEDLITLGDYFAVVPVREVILENCNLGDEGLRAILAGLLAAKVPDYRRRKQKQDLQEQGGVVERLVLKDNNIGPDGWKHLCLFIYLCRSLKFLDVSNLPLPRQGSTQQNGQAINGHQIPKGISEVLSKSLGERLGGSTLELINLGGTEPTTEQLGVIIDGLVQCGVRRLGLANNHIDEQGVSHIARYLAARKCEGLDLSGNDLKDHMEQIIAPIQETDPLWALSLSGCNLNPSSLCKIMPTLMKLENFRFIDLSHNQDLFQSTPSAVGLLRRYLPKMKPLKRIHLQDVAMTSEQAIALVEILPEVHQLAHINLLDNPELVALADARTEEAQEEACALYASLLAACRVSESIICVDIEVPSEQSGEIVKAMAKQVVAYCLRNMERIPDHDVGAAISLALNETQRERGESKSSAYPDVLVHLVGHDVLDEDESVDDDGSAPDDDYVIGGTGLVKALTCCLENRGDASSGQYGEFIGELEEDETEGSKLAAGRKAKDMSKHLLAGARKIRMRLQPALTRARAHHPRDEQNLRKLVFLDDTLQGIIKRFEDEYPDTREPIETLGEPAASSKSHVEILSASPPGAEDKGAISDGEDESKIQPPRPLSRSNSVLSKLLAEEEAQVLRVGHRFRSGLFTQEQMDVLSTVDDIGNDPKHITLLTGIAEDVGGELLDLVKQKGVIRAFKEDRDIVFKCMQEHDPDHWDNFVESQRKARANITVPTSDTKPTVETQLADESAIID